MHLHKQTYTSCRINNTQLPVKYSKSDKKPPCTNSNTSTLSAKSRSTNHNYQHHKIKKIVVISNFHFCNQQQRLANICTPLKYCSTELATAVWNSCYAGEAAAAQRRHTIPQGRQQSIEIQIPSKRIYLEGSVLNVKN